MTECCSSLTEKRLLVWQFFKHGKLKIGFSESYKDWIPGRSVKDPHLTSLSPVRSSVRGSGKQSDAKEPGDLAPVPLFPTVIKVSFYL